MVLLSLQMIIMGFRSYIFEGTLNNLTEKNMEKFYLRMFGDKRTYLQNIDRIPHRTIKSLHDELRWLYNRTMEQKEPGFRWDYAVTSMYDRVFPANNLNEYWEKQPGTKHVVLDLPHYIFHEWKSYFDFVEFVRKFKAKGQKK